jgi:hypothetical protein
LSDTPLLAASRTDVLVAMFTMPFHDSIVFDSASPSWSSDHSPGLTGSRYACCKPTHNVDVAIHDYAQYFEERVA